MITWKELEASHIAVREMATDGRACFGALPGRLVFLSRVRSFFWGGPVHNASEPPVTELLPVSTFTGAADEAAHSVACANFHPLTFRFHRSFR